MNIVVKHLPSYIKDPYKGTKSAWDKRCLITVSTHLKRTDRAFLDDYCKRHGTTPYRLLRAYLMDCISLAKMENAKQRPYLPA